MGGVVVGVGVLLVDDWTYSLGNQLDIETLGGLLCVDMDALHSRSYIRPNSCRNSLGESEGHCASG